MDYKTKETVRCECLLCSRVVVSGVHIGLGLRFGLGLGLVLCSRPMASMCAYIGEPYWNSYVMSTSRGVPGMLDASQDRVVLGQFIFRILRPLRVVMITETMSKEDRSELGKTRVYVHVETRIKRKMEHNRSDEMQPNQTRPDQTRPPEHRGIILSRDSAVLKYLREAVWRYPQRRACSRNSVRLHRGFSEHVIIQLLVHLHVFALTGAPLTIAGAYVECSGDGPDDFI